MLRKQDIERLGINQRLTALAKEDEEAAKTFTSPDIGEWNPRRFRKITSRYARSRGSN